MNRDEIIKVVLDDIESRRDSLIDISHYIWENPEIGYQEYKASKILMDELEKNGFTITKSPAGLETAFVAEKKGRADGPKVAIMSEYDSLGEIGHACGHNLFSVSAVGAAIAIAKVMDQLDGSVYVIGTPSEESIVPGSGGKAVMVRAGIFDDMDIAMITHAEGRSIVRRNLVASASVDVEFRGKAAHAGGAPFEGINALTAGTLMINNINAIRQQFRPRVSVNPIITKGGDTRNTIPDLCRLSLSVRAHKKAIIEDVLDKVKKCAEAGALVTGCEYDFSLNGEIYEDLEPNEALAQAFQNNMDELGMKDYLELEIADYAWDAGNVSYVCPTIAPYIKIGSEDLVGHTAEFREASNSEAGYNGMIQSAKLMAMTSIDYLLDADLRDRVQKEFKNKK